MYQHPTENRTFFAPDREPTVDLSVPLWHIGGLDNFSIPRPALTQAPQGQGLVNLTGSGPGGEYLPADMRAAYYGSGSLTGAGQSVGLVEFDGYNITDVVSTFNGAASYSANGSNYVLTYTTNGVPYNIQINNVLVGGASTSAPDPNDPSVYEAEAVLDIAQPIGMAPGLQQVLVYIAPASTLPVYSGIGDYDIFHQMASDNIAKQLSCSWNWAPDDYSTDDPAFQQMASQGQNMFVASGDSGSWPNGAYYYPEEDRYIVSVGGTDLTTSGPGGSWVSESGWADSGGGISPDDISIPTWQAGVANSSNGASTVYRNAPDVAMEANTDNYYCSFGSCAASGGTSFAAPRWAGYLALANQQEEASFSTSLGFINLQIYPIGEGSGYSAAFHDITSGSNGTYSAVTGYDLVTGWGSPNGVGLINALTTTPPPHRRLLLTPRA